MKEISFKQFQMEIAICCFLQITEDIDDYEEQLYDLSTSLFIRQRLEKAGFCNSKIVINI